jgi:hypothetical protein
MLTDLIGAEGWKAVGAVLSGVVDERIRAAVSNCGCVNYRNRPKIPRDQVRA